MACKILSLKGIDLPMAERGSETTSDVGTGLSGSGHATRFGGTLRETRLESPRTAGPQPPPGVARFSVRSMIEASATTAGSMSSVGVFPSPKTSPVLVGVPA